MNTILKLFLSALFALLLALAFSFFFLDLLERPQIDQILLVAFSTAALGYLIFSFWGNLPRIKMPRIDRSVASIFFRENIPGILLAVFFLAVYLSIGLKLNRPKMDTVDNFLDADNSSWMTRISDPNGASFEMRGPHPFAYFIFRPLGWLLNLITQNPPFSAIFLNTLAGALCVFFAWMFIRRQFRNDLYAFLIAFLLGISASHIFFGSVIETYIFSALSLIVFFLLLETYKDSIGVLVLAGLLTFGITFTNFVQNIIGYVQTRLSKNFRASIADIIRFTGLTISFGVVLSLIHAAWYPSSKLFFLLSDVQAENDYSVSLFADPAWKAIGRIVLLIRTILLYTVIAPQPYVFGKEVGGTFPRFNFFKIVPGTFSYSSYDGLGNILVILWAAMLFVAGAMFVLNLIRSRKTDLSLAFVLCLLFNFALHLNYGYEPFLYSPDWAYALIFFMAFGLAPFARHRWFQVGLAIFIVLLAYNQWRFIQFIFDTISPFIG